MKRLKKLIVPGIYVTIVLATFLSITLMTKKMEKTANETLDYDYSKSLIKEVSQVVYGEVEQSFEKPVVSDNATIVTHYYSKDDNDEMQQSSLIFYENTYLPSSGIVYQSDEEFDVIAVFDGKVVEVKEDDILGSYVSVMHNNNLTTTYYSLKDIKLKEGDQVVKGTILGKSSANKIYDKNSLFFEVHFEGKTINPETFFETNPSDLS